MNIHAFLIPITLLLTLHASGWAAFALETQASSQEQTVQNDFPFTYKMGKGAKVVASPSNSAKVLRTIRNYSEGYVTTSKVVNKTTWYHVQSFDKAIEGWVKKGNALTLTPQTPDNTIQTTMTSIDAIPTPPRNEEVILTPCQDNLSHYQRQEDI